MTNDFCSAKTKEKSKAMNMVIKLFSVDSKPCIKISDDLTKVSPQSSSCLRLSNYPTSAEYWRQRHCFESESYA